MKKLIVCSMLMAFAVATQAGEGKDCAKACDATAKATCCEKTASAQKAAMKLALESKGATLLVRK